MNCTFLQRATGARVPVAVAAGLALALVASAPGARATPFRAASSSVNQVLCDMPAITGQLTSTESRYTGSGSCIELQAQQSIDKATNTSEFPDFNNSTELFRANWTSQSTYNPVTKETWEKVTMPAPATDEKSPAGRPYGNYEARMICATDPWLTGIGVNCTGKTVNATGNLGDVESMLRQLNRPVTTPTKPQQLQALVSAHDRDAKLQTPVAKVDSNVKTSSIAIALKPTIAEPREGATYPPQTPLRVRIVPAKDAKDTTYAIQIQVQANFDWRDVTTVSAPAGVAQSPQGYRGWGGSPNDPVTAVTAIAGVYRIRARGTAPQQGQPGDWVQFKIDGQPGKQVDGMDQVKALPGGKAGAGAPSASALVGGKPSTASALSASPAIAPANKADAATLNPQPLPPKTAPAALTASPLDSSRSKTAPVLLNPQPLPPGGTPAGPGNLQRAPGTLQQAPSSLK